MDIGFLFFTLAPAIKCTFKVGHRVSMDDFIELSPEQYEKYYETEAKTSERVYAIYRRRPDGSYEYDNPILVCNESEITNFDLAWEYIEKQCKNVFPSLTDDRDKLKHVASQLPDVFIKGSEFEQE